MNESLLREEIERYEGTKDVVYLDTKGLPTVGIGHMDKSMIVGQHVSPNIIEMFYKQDSFVAINSRQTVY